MGAVFSQLWSSWFPAHKQYKLVLIGLDNAGKTTILYRLHLGEPVVTSPTIGSNCETVQHGNLTFEVWDLGGQANLRPAWAAYLQGADAVILAVDATDRGRLGIVKGELWTLLGHEHLRGAAILVLANKQDLPDAVGVGEISGALQLHSCQSHDWHVQAACATTGAGLAEGMEWLAQKVGGTGPRRLAPQGAPPGAAAAPRASPALPVSAAAR